MKMMKKILAVAAVLLIGCAAAFAFDPNEDFLGLQKIGNCSREDFEESLFDLSGDDYREMVMDIFDEEVSIFDMAVLDYADDDVEAFVNMKIKSVAQRNDMFVSVSYGDVHEGEGFDGGDIIDCYMIFSHFASARDIQHWVVMFSLNI